MVKYIEPPQVIKDLLKVMVDFANERKLLMCARTDGIGELYFIDQETGIGLAVQKGNFNEGTDEAPRVLSASGEAPLHVS
jgi:hypothetical protein